MNREYRIWLQILIITTLFLIFSSPYLYTISNILFSSIFKTYKKGCPTNYGILIHSILFLFIIRIIAALKKVREGKGTDYNYVERRAGEHAHWWWNYERTQSGGAIQHAYAAKNAAGTAQGTANTAVDAARNAQGTANKAVSDASTAQGTANKAATAAGTAQGIANKAVNDAAGANTNANEAKQAASGANTNANQAKQAASGAQITADAAAQAAVNAAQDAANVGIAANQYTDTQDQKYETKNQEYIDMQLDALKSNKELQGPKGEQGDVGTLLREGDGTNSIEDNQAALEAEVDYQLIQAGIFKNDDGSLSWANEDTANKEELIQKILDSSNNLTSDYMLRIEELNNALNTELVTQTTALNNSIDDNATEIETNKTNINTINNDISDINDRVVYLERKAEMTHSHDDIQN